MNGKGYFVFLCNLSSNAQVPLKRQSPDNVSDRRVYIQSETMGLNSSFGILGFLP